MDQPDIAADLILDALARGEPVDLFAMQVIQGDDPEAIGAGALLFRLAAILFVDLHIDRRGVGQGLPHQRQIGLGTPSHRLRKRPLRTLRAARSQVPGLARSANPHHALCERGARAIVRLRWAARFCRGPWR